MVGYLCEVAGVSRSGYYKYFSEQSQHRRKQQEMKDEEVKEIILNAFHFKRRKKGARQIKMTLAGQFNVVYNLKRIRRIMKKYNIICPIRKPNPYRRMMKATQEHSVVPNLLKREFKQNVPGKVLLTDITYLFFGKGKKAYLSNHKRWFHRRNTGLPCIGSNDHRFSNRKLSHYSNFLVSESQR